MSQQPIFALLPAGARDLLPVVLRRRRRLEERLREVFESWGYEPVATPAVELFEVFGRGLTEAERHRCLRFVAPGTDDVVALRSDVTPQVARLVSQHLRHRLEAREVVRLAYAADVIRTPRVADEAAEEHQVGVELIGDASVDADAELIALGYAALQAIGVKGAVFDLAHVGVARAVLGELELDDRQREALITRLARKDLSGIDGLLCDAGISAAGRGVVRALASLHGTVAVVERAKGLLGEAARRSLDELAAVIAAVGERTPEMVDSLLIDLGEVRGHDYYSGLRLRVWAPGSPQPLVRGGRYDGLLQRYGVAAPATGLAFGLGVVERLIKGTGLESGQIPAQIVAVEPSAPATARLYADREAARARATGLRAWVEPHLGSEAARALADRVGADLVTISGGETPPRLVRWQRSPSGWVRPGEEGKSEP